MRSLRDLNRLVLSLAILAALAAPAAYAGDARDIAPTGSLRVAVGVGPAPSPFWTTRDPATGELRGVSIELADAAAGKLGAPLQRVEYAQSGGVAGSPANAPWGVFLRAGGPGAA